MNKKKDIMLGIAFAVATVIFLVLFMTNDVFFNWAYARHKNVLSWYIRPLFIIPIVIFAFKRSLTGIFVSIFALFTSMFWFSAPETVNPQVVSFLEYEMEYLRGDWTFAKILMSLTVPLFFTGLVMAAWKRNWKWLMGVVIAAALLKMLWSVVFSGEAGMSVLKPAITGLLICFGGIYYYKKRHMENKK